MLKRSRARLARCLNASVVRASATHSLAMSAASASARRLGEVTMFDSAQAADIILDPAAVRRISEGQLDLLPLKQPFVSFGLACVSADQPVLADLPHVTKARHRRRLVGQLNDIVCRPVPIIKREEHINFERVHTGKPDLIAYLDQPPKFGAQQILRPAALLRDFVIGDYVGNPVLFAEVVS